MQFFVAETHVIHLDRAVLQLPDVCLAAGFVSAKTQST